MGVIRSLPLVPPLPDSGSQGLDTGTGPGQVRRSGRTRGRTSRDCPSRGKRSSRPNLIKEIGPGVRRDP